MTCSSELEQLVGLNRGVGKTLSALRGAEQKSYTCDCRQQLPRLYQLEICIDCCKKDGDGAAAYGLVMRMVGGRLGELPGLRYWGEKSSIPKINEAFHLPAWPPLVLATNPQPQEPHLCVDGGAGIGQERRILTLGSQREWPGCGKRAGHSCFLWDAG